MLRSAVIDASPLISRARTGLLDVLNDAAETVVVPPAVSLEVRAREGQDDEAVSALATMPWLRTGPAMTVPGSIATWDLGPGESEVIALAAGTRDATAVIDDRVQSADLRVAPTLRSYGWEFAGSP